MLQPNSEGAKSRKNNTSRDVSHIKAARQMLLSLMRGKQEGAGVYEEALQSRCRAFNAAALAPRNLSRANTEAALSPPRKLLLLNDDSIS